MVPKEIVIRAELPKTATGKISKKALTQAEPA
jgi:acyl-coenzyme A synthetase/AMP-(fatty) acid ligase